MAVLKDLASQSFFRFINYYCQFIPHFSTITELTEKGCNAIIGLLQLRSFSTTKKLLCLCFSPLPLRPFKTTLPGSRHLLSLWVEQYFLKEAARVRSRLLACSPSPSPWLKKIDCIGEHELRAIKLSLEEWCHLLEGGHYPVTSYTDHKNGCERLFGSMFYL